MANPEYIGGTILSYDAPRRVGVIKPIEGANLGFRLEDVVVPKGLAVGREVRFICDPADHFAYRIRLKGALKAPISRKKAAIRAIFGGVFGLHKFYLGYPKIGILLLFGTLFSWILAFLPLFAALGLGLIEGLVYLSLSDEEFEKRYLKGRRYWL